MSRRPRLDDVRTEDPERDAGGAKRQRAEEMGAGEGHRSPFLVWRSGEKF